MTQIAQIHTQGNICVNLRDLRENKSNPSTGRSFSRRLAYQLAASGIKYRKSV